MSSYSMSLTGLIASYNFDENTGDTLRDISGNGNHGKINGATWVSNGLSGSALSFDGINDSVVIRDLNIEGNLPRTLSVWFNAAVNEVNQTLWSSVISVGGDGSSKRAFCIDVKNQDGSCSSYPQWRITGHYFSYSTCSESTLTQIGINKWHHIALTHDGSRQYLYLNGKLIGQSSITDLNTIAGTTKIGARPTLNGYFKGLIDNVQIYNRALTESEIQNVFSSSLNSKPVFVSSPDTIALESHTYSYIVRATDAENDAITFSLDTFPVGMTIRNDTLTFIPALSQVGNHTVVIKAEDARGGMNTQTFKLSILPRSRQITLSNVTPDVDTVKMMEGDSVLFSLSAKSRSATAYIMYSWEKNRDMISSDSFYLYKAGFSSAGTDSLICVVFDGIEFNERKWILEIQNVPVKVRLLLPVSDEVASGDSLFKWECSDPDLDPATTKYEVQFMRSSQLNVPILTLSNLTGTEFKLNTKIQKTDLIEGTVLGWHVRAYDADGDTLPYSAKGIFFYSMYTGVENKSLGLKQRFYAIPNPFNPVTNISIEGYNQLIGSEITIVDASGRKIRTFSITKHSSSINFEWDGRDMNQRQCPTGVYICSINLQNYKKIIKLILAK
jgi:hypothetical protein